MTNSAISSIRQLSLSELLDEHPDEYVRYKVEPDDIGGQLLPLLSKGLYTNPLHAIREYAQNSIDAAATKIKIQITGDSVVIYDDGIGMNLEELREARKFGVSSKDLTSAVGFRGIGIYSGYDLCNRLNITTKKRGEDCRYVLRFDFRAMKERLAETASSSGGQLPLAELIEAYSSFSREAEDESMHYTLVQLEEMSDFHIKQLADHAALRAYILRNLPVDFDESFAPYREEINKALHQEVPGFRAVQVILEAPGAEREVVAKPAIPDLDAPIFIPIRNANNKKIAYLWACLHKPVEGKRGQIPDKYIDYRGFVYKVKGFTIGDNRGLRKYFKRGNATLYEWYTGEIYVIDPNVIPNAERYDFEANSAKDALDKAVLTALKELEGKASKYQTEERALDRFRHNISGIDHIAQQVNEGTGNKLDNYSELDRIIEELEEQKGRLPSDQKQWGIDAIKKARELKKQIGGEIDRPQPSEKQRKEIAKRRDTQLPITPGQTNPAGQLSHPQMSLPLTTSEPASDEQFESSSASEAQLVQIIKDVGWTLPEDTVLLVNIIDRALADVLIGGSVEYKAVLSDIATKLASELMS